MCLRQTVYLCELSLKPWVNLERHSKNRTIAAFRALAIADEMIQYYV